MFDNLFSLLGPVCSASLLIGTLFVLTVVPLLGKQAPRMARLGAGAR